MADEQPAAAAPSYDDVVNENATLRALVSQLQGEVRQRDDAIRALREAPTRVLDEGAADMFDRPYMGQAGGRR